MHVDTYLIQTISFYFYNSPFVTSNETYSFGLISKTPRHGIFILWNFVTQNVFFKGVLTVSLVIFLTLFVPSQQLCYIDDP